MDEQDEPIETATFYWGFDDKSLQPCIIWELPAFGVCATHQFVARSPANNNFQFVKSLNKLCLHDSFGHNDKFWQVVSIEQLAEPIGDDEVVANLKKKWKYEAQLECERQARLKEQQERSRIENERLAKIREAERIQWIADEKKRKAEEPKLRKRQEKVRIRAEKEQAKARIQAEKQRVKEQAAAEQLQKKKAWINRYKDWGTLAEELHDLLLKLVSQKPETAKRNLNKLLADYRTAFVPRSAYNTESAFSTRYLKLYQAQKSGFIAFGNKSIRIDEVSECIRVRNYIRLVMKTGNEHELSIDDFLYVEQLFS